MAGDEPLAFGAVLSRYRLAVGLTQEELAERAALSVRGISDIERGVRTQPRPHTVRQLAEALQLSPDDRVLFEQAATAASTTSHMGDALSEGSFLGALPASGLVAREQELERIRSVLDEVAKGAGHLLLLGGEVGVGKTRLLQEAMVEADNRGYLVLTGRCQASERGSTYYLLLEVLSALTVSAPAAVRSEVQRGWKRVQQLVGGRSAGDGETKGSRVEQRQLFGTVSDLLLLIARSVPLALLLDDLHWADRDSLRLLQHLAYTSRSSAVLLAGAFCDHRLTEEHPELAQALHTLSHERLMERLSIRRLSLEETTQFVAMTMGRREVSEEFASFVHRRTKGIPRLIDQLVRSLGGRLELLGEIGAGSMGRVFRALDRTTGTVVAAKLVLARSEIDLDALLRFQQEGAVLARLKHPHVVAVYDTFAEEHATCIIMELLEGQSLGQLLRDGPLPLHRAQRLGLQVADALSYAHSQSIVHRDIKPDNVMVLEGDQVKVTDFGIARILQPDTSLQTIATTGMRMGTPLYMAPEQIEGKRIDGRTDVYALGAMLYHMVTGRPPFEGSDALTVAVKHLQEEPVPPSSINLSIPAVWDVVILKAMAKEPAERFQTVATLGEAITALPIEQESGSGRMRAGRSRSDTPARARWASLRSSRARAVAAGAILTAGIAVVIFSLSPGFTTRASHQMGRPIAVWGIKMPRPFHFQAPLLVAAGPRGDIYLGDDGSWLTDINTSPGAYTGILRVSRSGTVLAAFGSHGSRPGQVGRINDIAIDGHGTVYIADEQNNRIDRFTADGRPLPSIGSIGVNPGQFFHPQAVAVDGQGNIYVADNHNDRVQEVSATGQPLEQFGSPGTGRDQLGGPNALALDRHGNIYVTEFTNRRIHKFAPNGKTLAIWGGSGTGPGEFMNPQNVKIDSAGNVYVVDTDLARIEKFTSTGTFLAMWGSNGSGPGQFEMPTGLAIDDQGYAYVGDLGTGRLQKFRSSGKLVGQWKAVDLARPLFVHPSHAALDRHGDAYVTDATRDEVEKLSPAGALLLRWGRHGTRPGQFKDPSGIALGPNGDVYVADSGNGRVQEFSPGGAFLSAWQTGAGGQVGRPTGIAVDRHGTIYVTDNWRNLVEGYSSQHKLRLDWGATPAGFALYQLRKPDGIAVDRRGDVYVADTGNHRIVEFAPGDTAIWFAIGGALSPGRMIRTWSQSAGTNPGSPFRPTGVALDARGKIYATDSTGSFVQVFAPSGTMLARWGSKGVDPGQFHDPTGIAADAAGNIYVVDSGNARIQKFPTVG